MLGPALLAVVVGVTFILIAQHKAAQRCRTIVITYRPRAWDWDADPDLPFK